jgi:PAS domain S-box-containing protein
MESGLTKSGIGNIGDIPWGTHFCQFYESKKDLLDILIPYFKTGLERNEFCIWGVFYPLDVRDARNALRRAVPGADARMASGDIEIVPQSLWYRGDSADDLLLPIRDWETKLEKALARGCAGMRVNVSAAWLVQRDRRDLNAYEHKFSEMIANRRMILLCAYPLPAGQADEISSAGHTHRFAIARRDGSWQAVATPELIHARAEVKRLNRELELRGIERTRERAIAESDRKQEAETLRDTQEALHASRERSLCYFGLGLVGMAIVSPTKGCIEVNDRLCDILGYKRSELTRTPWPALVHPDDLARDTADYHRILSGEIDGYLVPKRWLRKNGDTVHTNLSVTCRRHEDGSVDYFAAMIAEVPEPAKARLGPGQYDRSPYTEDLSRREREVARLVGMGRTVKEIAALLALSEKTVSTYRTRILTKLKLKSTAELIRYALQNRLVE